MQCSKDRGAGPEPQAHCADAPCRRRGWRLGICRAVSFSQLLARHWNIVDLEGSYVAPGAALMPIAPDPLVFATSDENTGCSRNSDFSPFDFLRGKTFGSKDSFKLSKVLAFVKRTSSFSLSRIDFRSKPRYEDGLKPSWFAVSGLVVWAPLTFPCCGMKVRRGTIAARSLSILKPS